MTSVTSGGDIVELTLDGFAHGGAAVGRLPDRRACFVAYAIPGERVRVRITDDRRRWARATLVDVLEASPDRVTPPCPLFGPDRCGGCTLQHIAPARQAQLLGGVIADQLRRIGHIEVPGDGTVEVLRPNPADGLGYRSRARFTVTRSGRLAFRKARSHDPIVIDDCPLLVPAAHDLLARVAAGWRRVTQVALQVGTDGTGTLAVRTNGRPAPPPTDVPTVVQARNRPAHRDRDTHVRYEVDGRRFVADATSFFQASVPAAELLVDLVRRFTAVQPDARVIDCYAGVGLFSVALAADGAHVTAIEASATACADARTNCRRLPVTVVRRDLASPPEIDHPVDAVVLDPPRIGAGAEVMSWIAALGPVRVTYISCDPATFARDAAMLVAAGYRLARIVGIDQFTHTRHVELVAGFERHPQ
ncbi:MAG: class I SAM-dependent RNA methyltransferase [Actinobacteria bacterium]|nr:class I SAM-dependent RNA methyltransferase [Actinomycetota bacterium]